MLLQSMSMDPSDYGWTIESNGYESVPTLDLIACTWEIFKVHKLLYVMVKEIVATDDAAVRNMMSTTSQQVEIAKALPAKIAVMMRRVWKPRDWLMTALKKYISNENNHIN